MFRCFLPLSSASAMVAFAAQRVARSLRHRVPLCVQEKLDAWDPSKADDVQYLMNMAKKYIILDTLAANGGKCTYEALFARSDEVCTHTAP